MAGLWNKHFFAGVAVGLALAICLIMAGAGVITFFVMKMVPDQQQMALLYQEPEFPKDGEEPILGRADLATSVQGLDGETLAMSSFKGRVIFLNLWATWCRPCKAEMPGIQRLVESLEGEDVAFLIVSDEELDKVKGYASSTGLSVPTYVWAGDTPSQFKSRELPTTYIIDAAGDIVFRHVGAAKWDGEACEAFLRRLAQVERPGHR